MYTILNTEGKVSTKYGCFEGAKISETPTSRFWLDSTKYLWPYDGTVLPGSLYVDVIGYLSSHSAHKLKIN